MSKPIDACPACGERTLTAVCMATVEYSITNEGDSAQDWSRQDVDDDTSEPMSVRCDSCGAEFEEITLDGNGYLVALRP